MTVDIRAGHVSDFAEGQRVMLDVDGREVFVFARDGRFYAYENICAHMGGPVGEGILMGKVEVVLGPNQETIREKFSTTEIHLVCPWHGWEYDIETGECVALRRYRLRRYRAVQRGDEVYVVA